jgi:molybdate transport system substrate-binding protein
MRKRAAITAVLGAFVYLATFVSSTPAQETGGGAKPAVQIFAAASASNAIGQIKQRFAATTGVEVRTSFGSSAVLARQVLSGADADILLSADPKWAKDLAEKGFVAEQHDLLGNRLVIVVPDDSTLSITKPEDLTNAAIIHIAMGEPRSVPAGVYGRRALEKLGLWKQLEPKVAAADDVRHALAFVEAGAAEAGIVYATDAAASRQVRVVAEFPVSLTGPIRYPLVLLKHGVGTPAESFYKFLSGPESLQVFRKYGFSILAGSEAVGRPKP